MRTFLGCVMISNAALFFFGALQHAGIAIGRFHEPRIVPATIVESLCGLSLMWGVSAVFGHSHIEWRTAMISQLDPARRSFVRDGCARHGQGSAHGKQRLVPSHNADPDWRQPPHPVFRKVSTESKLRHYADEAQELEDLDRHRDLLENFVQTIFACFPGGSVLPIWLFRVHPG